MAALQQLEFFLLRYSGDATKGESVNLGVVAVAPEHGPSGGLAEVRFTRNLRRLHCFDPLLDTDELEALEQEIRRDLKDPQRRAEMMKRAGDSWSNVIQFDQLQGCLTQSPAKELERLSSLYLETPTAIERHEVSGRQRILTYIKDELEKAGVLRVMQRDIPVAEFTRPGDPLKLDFGYAAGTDFKFLQAVSLMQRVDRGLILAARFPQIAAGLSEKTGIQAWLTAIVDDDLPRRDEVTFALEMMQEGGIVVSQTASVPQIANEIRVELKL